MKIALGSDIHLEFGDINLQNTENANVLILSGDIMVATDLGAPDPHNFLEGARSTRFVDFFKRCSFQFPHVIYVMGNHEHYHGDFATTGTKIRSMLESNLLSNVYFLDKETKVIDDVIFVGGTLWTDMNKEDEMTMQHVSHRMNDFQCVRNSNTSVYRSVPIYQENPDYDPNDFRSNKYSVNEQGLKIQTRTKKKKFPGRFTPEDTVEDHKKMLGYISAVIEGKYDQKFVVVGHHAPSKGSEHPKYKRDSLMNGAYNSRLDEFILDNPQIKLWTHGHTHEDFDYMIGATRVVCNPRGYINHESRADNFKLVYIDV